MHLQGNDLRDMSDTILGILTWKAAIRVNQVRKHLICFAPLYTKNDHFTKAQAARDNHRESTQK
jgi:hypothetical protein